MMATVMCWIVAALHVVFGLAETVGWSAMAARFGYSKERTEATRPLALNQGFYNIGVAALLAWALLTGQPATVFALLIFIVAMSLVGAFSVRWTLFVLQGVPAIAALVALYF